MKQTPAQRLAKMREKAKRQGRKRREYYATDDEHAHLKRELKNLRSDGND